MCPDRHVTGPCACAWFLGTDDTRPPRLCFYDFRYKLFGSFDSLRWTCTGKPSRFGALRSDLDVNVSRPGHEPNRSPGHSHRWPAAAGRTHPDDPAGRGAWCFRRPPPAGRTSSWREPRSRDDALTPVRADLDQPIQASDGTILGTIRAIDTASRLWTAGDREVLSDLAGSMAARLGLGASHASPVAEEANDFETPPATLDHLPGLVFEWRKTGTAAVSYNAVRLAGHRAGYRPFRDRKRCWRDPDGLRDPARPCTRTIARRSRPPCCMASTRTRTSMSPSASTTRIAILSYRVQASVRQTEDAVRWAGLVTDVSELAQARREAEAARAAQDVVLVNVSHELRTPLQAIVGFARFPGDRDPAPSASPATRRASRPRHPPSWRSSTSCSASPRPRRRRKPSAPWRKPASPSSALKPRKRA